MGAYSDTVMDHFQHPRHVGELVPCDLRGLVGTPGHGRFILFTARLEGERVSEIAFKTYGCGPAIAAASVLTELVLGRPLSDTAGLTRDDLLAALGGLPEDKQHCADLAVEAWRNLVASRLALLDPALTA